MNFKEYDIENSKDLINKLISQGVLNIEYNQLDSFLQYFIQYSHFERERLSPVILKEILIEYIQSLSPDEIDHLMGNVVNDERITNYFVSNLRFDPNNIRTSILGTLKSLSIIEIKDFEKRFINESKKVDNLISKAFQIEKRQQLKKDLIRLDTEVEGTSFDEAVTKAFHLEKRQELKQKLNALDVKSTSTKGRLVSMRPYLKAISIAASIILILLVWQPQHTSDKKLFADYSNSIDNSSFNDFTQAERIKDQDGLRGEEEHFKNFTFEETLQLQEAIILIRQKEFEKAKEIFNRFPIEKEKNPGLALYLSIAQLNSDDVEKAIINLEYLNKLPVFSYPEDVKFHLAFAYLKTGERKKAKELLNELIASKSKFSDKAQQTLKKIRWF